MKRRNYLVLLLALIFVLTLTACGGGPDKRIDAAGQLISKYFNTDAQSGNISVLKVQSYTDGYVTAAMYKGSGSHLVLFKMGKGGSAITANGEGEAASSSDYSVNIISDGDKTILFGDFKDSAADYKKIDFVFDNDSHITETVQGDRGYVVVADGNLKIKDFTLFGTNDDVKSTYQDFKKANSSITRTTFMEVSAK